MQRTCCFLEEMPSQTIDQSDDSPNKPFTDALPPGNRSYQKHAKNIEEGKKVAKGLNAPPRENFPQGRCKGMVAGKRKSRSIPK